MIIMSFLMFMGAKIRLFDDNANANADFLTFINCQLSIINYLSLFNLRQTTSEIAYKAACCLPGRIVVEMNTTAYVATKY